MSGDGIPIPVSVPGGDATVALLERMAIALERTGEKTEEAGKKAQGATVGMSDFKSAIDLVTGTVGQIIGLVDAIAALSAEQAHLSENSARLGLDFDAGAAAFGRFADETEAMGAATQFASRNVRLTQTELEALGRVAGAFSRDNMTTTKASVDLLTDALLNGNERGLRQFGAGLERTAGPAHTVAERLAALTAHAREVTPATDDATDAMARYRDVLGDAERTAASAFTTELTRLASLHTSLGQASLDSEELSRDMTALGTTAAHVAAVSGAAIAAVFSSIALGIRGTIDEVRAGFSIIERLRNGASFSSAAAGARAEFFGAGSASAAANNARETAMAALSGAWNDTGPANANTGAVRGRAGEDPNSMTFTAEQVDAIERDRAARRRRGRNPGAAAAAHAAEQRREHEIAQEFAAIQRGHGQGTQDLAAMFGGATAERSNTAGKDAASRASAEAEYSSSAQTAATNRQNSLAGRLGAFDQGETAEARAAKDIKKAWEGASEALSAHLGLALSGAETWETAGAAMRDALQATLGEVLVNEGKAEFARSLASLAALNPGLAALHIAAGVALVGVGSALGAGSASPPAAGARGNAAPRNAADVSPRGAGSQGGGQVIHVSFGGPVYAMGNSKAEAGEWMGGAIREAVVQRGLVLTTGTR